jgi:hypothetical protein
MLDNNDFTYEDNIDFENFEFSSISDESLQRQREPFVPMPGGGFPPTGNPPPFNPPNFNPPSSSGNFSPNFNYPGGGVFNPPGMPKSPPPNYLPHKTEAGVQKIGISGGVSPQAVSANSIRFCLYKYTYIWEENGQNYWAFPLNINRRTVSGFRWFRRNWVYWGIDLRRIESFICYRSNSEDNCKDCINLKRNDTSLSLDNQKEYSLNGTRDVYTKTLASIDIPAVKEDIITKTVGYLDDTEITSEIPCVKARNISYRVNLEVTYPSEYDIDLKKNINELANEASDDAFKVISGNRSNDSDSDSLEFFSSSTELIPEALRTFSDSFNNKLTLLNSSIDNLKDITYSIRSEKIYNNWKPYFYNDSLY